MLRLTVVTPERAFIDEQCLAVSLPGRLGEMQVLEGHVPSLIELKPGIVVYENNKKEHIRFVIAQGFAEIESSSVVVLCEMAKHRTELDKESETASLKELEQKLLKHDLLESEELKLKARLEMSVASLNLLE
jgi:F-type H+-transporting ATPase subunit epsilon